MKYTIHKEIQRFTVFTLDAINTNQDQRYQGTFNQNAVNNRRKFVFKLPIQSHLKSKKCKIAIESIFCIDYEAEQLQDDDTPFHHSEFDTSGLADDRPIYNMSMLNYRVNSGKYELYSIRCGNIDSTHICDTRPQQFQSGSLIYNGKLDFNNFNPKECFVYDCSPNIINDYFTLYIDNNHFLLTELGIKDGLQVAVSFIVYDVEDFEDEPLSNAPNVNLKYDLVLNRGFR